LSIFINNHDFVIKRVQQYPKVTQVPIAAAALAIAMT